MTTLHLIDPEIRPMLELIPELVLTNASIKAIRTGLDDRSARLPEPCITPLRVAVERAGLAEGLPLEIFTPTTRKSRAAILHIHGGGMVMGSPRINAARNARIAMDVGVLVASVDYRLAPEFAFPAPQEDCLTALRWLVARADALGIDASHIVIMGESAGAGLAAAVCIMARDLGEIGPSAQILTYPMLDHRTGTEVCPYQNKTTGEFCWTRASNRFGWTSLRGDYAATDDRIGWFSPARVTSCEALPPAFIAVGGLDLFADESMEYARRLNAAGVPIELHVYPGAIHGFEMMHNAAVAKQYGADLRNALDRFSRTT